MCTTYWKIQNLIKVYITSNNYFLMIFLNAVVKSVGSGNRLAGDASQFHHLITV